MKKGPDGLKLSSKPRKEPANGRKTDAIRRLGVTEEQLVRYPNITDTLFRAIGGREKVVHMMRFSDDPSIEAFLNVYDRIPLGDQKHITLEAVAIKGEVNAMQLLGATVSTAKQVMGSESALELIMNHPEVVRKTVQFATTLPGASADRKMLHDAAGFTPQHSPIAVNVQQNNAGSRGPSATNIESIPAVKEINSPLIQSQAALPPPSPEEAFTTAFPSINRELEKWGEKRRKQREMANKSDDIIDGEIVEGD